MDKENASTKEAFYRGINAAKIEHLEKRVDGVESSLRWISRMTITILVAVIVSGFKIFMG